MSFVYKINILKIKLFLKKFKLICRINANIKSHIEKSNWKKLVRDYGKKCIDSSPAYPDSVQAGFRKINQKLDMQKSDGSLLVIYVGTDYNQDFSGFGQALKLICNTIFFHNKLGGYGLNLKDKNDKKFFFDKSIQKENSDQLIDLVLRLRSENKILIIGQMMANFISKEALSEISLMSIPIINISMDDKLSKNWTYCSGVRMGGVGLAKDVDITLTTTPEVVGWYISEGGNAAFFPLGSSKELFAGDPLSKNRDIDVLFIGNKYGYREDLINYLINNDVKVSAWGTGWENGFSDFERSIELSKRAKIVLGLGTVGHTRNHFTLKLRDFDGPMSGALYLTHRSKVISDIFKEGVHIECYLSKEECLNKINFYLGNDYERLALARAGQLYSIENYEWSNRLSWIFSKINCFSLKFDE